MKDFLFGEIMGGELFAQSEGDGMSFVVVLPLEPASTQPQAFGW